MCPAFTIFWLRMPDSLALAVKAASTVRFSASPTPATEPMRRVKDEEWTATGEPKMLVDMPEHLNGGHNHQGDQHGPQHDGAQIIYFGFIHTDG